MEKNKSKVSVVIPVYNAERYLEQCLDSVINQTYHNIEIICVDDGSTDGSRDIIENYQIRDDRIRVYDEENSGAGVARNKGINLAKGDYILFIDADDYIHPKMVETMLDKIGEQGADVIICSSDGYDDKRKAKTLIDAGLDTEKTPIDTVFNAREISDDIFQITSGWAWDSMFRLAFIRDNKLTFQEIRAANDAYFVYMSYIMADTIFATDQVLVTHRTNVEGSVEKTRGKHWRCSYEMLYALKDSLEQRGKYEMYKRSFLNLAANYIVWNLNTIYEKECLIEYFKYTKEKGLRRTGLHNLTADFWGDEDIYRYIEVLKKGDLLDYLLHRTMKEAEEIENSRIISIQKDEEYVRWAGYQERHIKFLDKKKRWVFPEGQFSGKRIVIYGYGDVGKDLCLQCIREKDPILVMAVDRNYKKMRSEEPVRVCEVSEIYKEQYDYIIISILNKKLSNKIRRELLLNGIPEEKVVVYTP